MSRDYSYGSDYEDLHDAEWDDAYEMHLEQEDYAMRYCGWHGDQHCDQAGTEYCDFTCMLGDQFRAYTPPPWYRRLRTRLYVILKLYWAKRLYRKFRRWKAKCPDCGQRFHKHNDDCIPF